MPQQDSISSVRPYMLESKSCLQEQWQLISVNLAAMITGDGTFKYSYYHRQLSYTWEDKMMNENNVHS